MPWAPTRPAQDSPGTDCVLWPEDVYLSLSILSLLQSLMKTVLYVMYYVESVNFMCCLCQFVALRCRFITVLLNHRKNNDIITSNNSAHGRHWIASDGKHCNSAAVGTVKRGLPGSCTIMIRSVFRLRQVEEVMSPAIFRPEGHNMKLRNFEDAGCFATGNKI